MLHKSTVCPEGGHIPQSCLASGIIPDQTYFPTLAAVQKSDNARSALLLEPHSLKSAFWSKPFSCGVYSR